MEPSLSDYEEHKERLRQSTADLKKALEVEIDRMKENASEWGKTLLVVGGVVLFTYAVVKAFRRPKAKKRKQQEVAQTYYPVPVKQPNMLVRKILDHIAFFVLGMVQQKLLQYLEQRQSHEKTDS